MGFILVANFVINIVDAELGDRAPKVLFEVLDLVFTLIYVLELLLNLFVNWLRPFLRNGWSIFDTICVIIGVVGTFAGVGSAKVVRSIRILRIVRVLRRFKSLQRIVVAISRCVFPLLNTFVIVMVVNVIYAVIAAELFAPYSSDLFGSFSKSSQARIFTSTFYASSCIQHTRALTFWNYSDHVPGWNWRWLDDGCCSSSTRSKQIGLRAKCSRH